MTGECAAVLQRQPEMALFLVPAIGHAGGPRFFARLDTQGLRLTLPCLVEASVVALAGLVAHHAP